MRIEKSVRALVSPGALALAISFLAAGAPAALPDDGILGLALRSPNERSGDYDALAAEWLAALPRAAEEFEAEIVSRRLPQILPFLRNPQALIPLLEKAAGATYAHGSVRQGLLGVLAGLYESAGREEDRLKIDASRGFVHEWLVIGPFGKGAGSPFTASFPPEDEQRIDRTYRDGWQTLSWRKAIRGPGEKLVHPWRHAYPASGVVYFLSQVECREELEAMLLRSSQDSLQVWLNGRLVADDDAGASFLGNLRLSPVRLRAGWNRVLVKTRAPFTVQLVDPAGFPFPSGAWKEEEGLQVHAMADAASREPAEARPGAVEVWTRRVEELASKGPGSPEETARLADARMGLALVHQARGRDELAVAEAEKALELRPEDPAFLYHAGGIFGSARYLPSSVSKNRSKAAFESAIARDPAFLPAYERSARHLEEDEQYLRAAARMREGLEKSPDFFRGLLRLQSIFSRKRWLAEEIDVVKAIERIAPASPVPATFWSRHHESLGNVPEALRQLRKAFDLDRDQVQLLHGIQGMALEMGKVDEAEAALREAVRLAPDEPRQDDALADFLADQGRYDEALEVARRLAERNPDDSRGARRIAEILDRAGKGSGNEYQKALALEPGDLELKRYIVYRGNEPKAAGEGGTGLVDAFWGPYDAKLEEWTAAIPEKGPLLEKVASLLVLDITVLRFEVDGSSSEYVHQAFKLLSEESKEELANVRAPGEVVTLRTLTAAGESLQPVPGEGKRSYVMPGLSPGAIIEFAYRVDTSRRPTRGIRIPPFFFQDTDFRHSVLLSRYVILLPKGPGAGSAGGFEPGFIETRLAEASTTGVKLAQVEKTVRELGDGRTAVIYEARNVPRIERENMLPSPEEILPNVILIEKQSWADVAGLLRNRFWGATRPTPELREAAARVTSGIDSPIDRAKAIYRYVNDLVAKGGGTNQAVQVLLEKSGDRTTLFKALCDLAAVPTHWAFLRPNEDVLPRAHWSYPRPEMFAFPFVAVEEEGKAPVYVSLSARGTPFGRLPESIEGGKAMVLLTDGERIDPLPPARPEDSATSIRGTLRLGANSDAEAEVELSSRAVAFYAMKDQLKTYPAFQKDVVLRQMATQFFPGARVKKAEMRGLDDPDAAPAFVLDLTAPKLLKSSGDSLLLKPVFQPSQMVKLFGGRSVRELPLHLTRSRVSRDEIRVETGDACDLERTPRDVLLASALGEYALTYRSTDRTVVVERRLTLRPGRLEPQEYDGFLEFCQKIDAAEEENIVFPEAVPEAMSSDPGCPSDYEGLQGGIRDLALPELETWENQYPDRDYWVDIEIPEFTCVCPKTGLPDFATIAIRYVPDASCVELKSLKLYITAYRNLGIFHEHVVNKVLDDLVRALRPRRAEVRGDFGVRGGIRTRVEACWPQEDRGTAEKRPA